MQNSMQRLWEWLKHPAHAVPVGVALGLYALLWDYFFTYVRRVPVRDQWTGALEFAFAVENSTLSFEDLFIIGGHRNFSQNLLTLLVNTFTDWNVLIENMFNPLVGLLNLLLLLYFFAKAAPHLLHWVIIPFAMLIFAISQEFNWTVSQFNTWNYSSTYALGVLAILLYARRGVLAFGIAILLSAMMTVSFNGGVGIWVVLLMGLWISGYRDWRYYAFAIVSTVIAAVVYLSILNLLTERYDTVLLDTAIPQPLPAVRFMFLLFGNAFSINSETLAATLGAIGMVLFALNAWHLWQVTVPEKRLRLVGPWVVLTGYALSVAAMITIGRLEQAGSGRALETRYIANANLLWCSLIALALMGGYHIIQQADKKRWQQALLAVNIIFLSVLPAFYIRNQITMLQRSVAQSTGHYIFETRPEDGWFQERCVLAYPIDGSDDCLALQLQGSPDAIYQMAAHRIAIFNNVETDNIMPPTYDTSTPIIVSTSSAWLNVYVRDWMLAGVPEDSLLHIAPPAPDALLAYENPPQTLYDMDTIVEQLDGQETIWVIAERGSDIPVEELQALGYVPTPLAINHLPRYRDAHFDIVRWNLAPDDAQLIPRLLFGDEHITLLYAEYPSEVAPCEAFTIQTWWRAQEAPRQNYTFSLSMLNENGEVSKSEGYINDVPMQLWAAGQIFVAEDQLTMPCDAEGTYAVEAAFFAADGGLPAIALDGEALGERTTIAFITTDE